MIVRECKSNKERSFAESKRNAEEAIARSKEKNSKWEE
jgi:hypothetical protein